MATAVIVRRLVMSGLAWILAVLVIGLIFLTIGFDKEDGWPFTVATTAALFGCNILAIRVWRWSRP